jgi:hypothetical protein
MAFGAVRFRFSHIASYVPLEGPWLLYWMQAVCEKHNLCGFLQKQKGAKLAVF